MDLEKDKDSSVKIGRIGNKIAIWGIVIAAVIAILCMFGGIYDDEFKAMFSGDKETSTSQVSDEKVSKNSSKKKKTTESSEKINIYNYNKNVNINTTKKTTKTKKSKESTTKKNTSKAKETTISTTVKEDTTQNRINDKINSINILDVFYNGESVANVMDEEEIFYNDSIKTSLEGYGLVITVPLNDFVNFDSYAYIYNDNYLIEVDSIFELVNEEDNTYKLGFGFNELPDYGEYYCDFEVVSGESEEVNNLTIHFSVE